MIEETGVMLRVHTSDCPILSPTTYALSLASYLGFSLSPAYSLMFLPLKS